MPKPEVVRRLAAGRYAGVAALGVLVAAAFGAGIALAQPKQTANRPLPAPSPAAHPATAGSLPPGAVKAPPPRAAAFDGTPPPPAAGQPTAAPKMAGGAPAVPPPVPPPSHDPADK